MTMTMTSKQRSANHLQHPLKKATPTASFQPELVKSSGQPLPLAGERGKPTELEETARKE